MLLSPNNISSDKTFFSSNAQENCTSLYIIYYREREKKKQPKQKKHTPPLTQKEVKGIYQPPLNPTGCQGQVAA
jgi:hypothetical protein